MTMEILKKFTFNAIVDYLYNAKKEVYWISPTLTTEIAHTLKDIADLGIEVSILTDLNPDRFRNYEGELEAIDLLLKNNRIAIYKARDLGVGFVVVDKEGYAFFTPQRAYEQDGDRFNGLKLDKKTINRLISLLFKPNIDTQDIFESFEYDHLIDSLQLSIVEETDIIRTRKELEIDPPLKLNIKRLINVYKSQFQIVDIKFTGSKLHIKKIKLPNNALPFSDSRLKNSIESQLRLFSEINKKEYFNPFFEVIDQYDILKGQYLTYIKSRDKNVIKKIDKPQFDKYIISLNSKIVTLKNDLKFKLQEEIINTKAAIRDNLKQFIMVNPTEPLLNLSERGLEQGAEQQANDIVSRINFPTAESLLANLSLQKNYYDLTWEDLNDSNVIKEFLEKGLITKDEMSEFNNVRRAYEIDPQ